MGRRLGWASMLPFGVALLLAGCVSMTVADTTPLRPEQLSPPGGASISTGGYRLSALAPPDDPADLIVLVAISGGGKRSAAYAYGALKGMREVTVPTRRGPRPLLDEVAGISSISGGSFTAAYYALYRDAAFGRFEEDFLYADTNSYIWGIYLLPWNWAWLTDPTVGTNDYMERVYDRTMFHGARFKDLAARGRPVLAIGATDLNYGLPFIFTQEAFDVLCADLSDFPVARAVAASNGFPGLFSPITLTNRAAECGGRKPGWLTRVTESQREDPLSRLGTQANAIDRYLDPNRTRYLHLADGGISDNLGLRVTGGMMQNFAQSPAALAAHGYDRLRRILVISIDGQGTQDPSVAQRKAVGGLLAIFGLVSGGQIDRYNFETLTTVNGQMQGLAQALRAARCARGRMIDGARCDDVEAELIHISLAAMPAGAEKDALLAIPTGLTLEREDVDRLIAAGHGAVLNSARLHRFLDGYPVRPGNATAPQPPAM